MREKKAPLFQRMLLFNSTVQKKLVASFYNAYNILKQIVFKMFKIIKSTTATFFPQSNIFHLHKFNFRQTPHDLDMGIKFIKLFFYCL